MKSICIKIKSLAAFLCFAGMTSSVLFTFQSCKEDLSEGDYAIAEKQTISDYLAETPNFSKFKAILDRVPLGHKEGASSLSAVLSARGNYTIFAPNNEAIDAYLAELGVASVEQLDDEQAELIAYSCIIDNGDDSAYESPDFPQGNAAFTKSDLNDRTITCDEVAADDGTTYYELNGKCRVVKFDVQLSNGYLHEVATVIAPSNEMVPDLIKMADNMHVMGVLLKATGWDAKLTDFIDLDYENAEHEQTIKLPNLATFPVAQHRYLGYTALVETDDVYAKYNVPMPENYNFDEGGTCSNLQAIIDAITPIAEAAYGTEAKGDITNERNAVNRFVAYHFLEGKMAHNKFVSHVCEYGYKGGDIRNPQQTELTVDLTDYFYTTGSMRGLVKITHEAKSKDLYANRVCTYDVEGSYEQTGVKHPGVKIAATNPSTTSPEELNENNAKNGYYYPVDDLFILDRATADALGGERIRFDITTILPEILNNGCRSQSYQYFDSNDYFSNISGCSDDTKLLYLTTASQGAYGWCDLEGDEFMVLGIYDFVLRLPPVPKEGTYEIRMGCSLNSLRGMCQIYFGKDPKNLLPVGLPFDMRMSTTGDNVGWFSDGNLDDATIREKDKNMRNQGYMKGPKIFCISNGDAATTARDYSGHVRLIITTEQLSPNETYYMRFKSCLEDNASQFFSDYFEFCPRSVYNGVEAEDIW